MFNKFFRIFSRFAPHISQFSGSILIASPDERVMFLHEDLLCISKCSDTKGVEKMNIFNFALIYIGKNANGERGNIKLKVEHHVKL